MVDKLAQVRRGPGRPRYEPTDEHRRRVEDMAGFGMTHPQIAAAIGISDVTLEKYFPTELAAGAARCIEDVARNLVTIAKGSGPTAVQAAQFYLKTRARWKETSVVEAQELPKIAVE